MNNQKILKDRFFKWLARWASKLDDHLRFLDFKLNRTSNGWMQHTFGISRHSWPCLALPALLAGIIVLGVPEFGARLGLSLITGLFVFILVKYLTKLSIRNGKTVFFDLVLQAVVVFGVAGTVWIIGGDTYKEGVYLYKHLFVLSVGIVGAAIVASGYLADWLIWRDLRKNSNYGEALTRSELFTSRDRQPSLGCRHAALLG